MRPDLKRSRTGCATCRRNRLKCDERRPKCAKCQERGVHCGGYHVQLRWMEPSEAPIAPDGRARPRARARQSLTNHDKTSSSSQNTDLVELVPYMTPTTLPLVQEWNPVTHQIPRCINPFGRTFDSSLDRHLFEHYQQTFLQAVHMNRSRSPSIQSMYTAAIMEPKSTILPVILAAAAAHISVQSNPIMSSVQLYTRKQKALESLRLSLGAIQQRRRSSKAPEDFYSELLTASVGLAGIEVTLGAEYEHFIALVMGSASLVVQYRKYNTGQPTPPLFILNQKMLAYLDVMSSVPYPRPPILGQEYWLTDAACLEDANTDGSQVDPTLGCFATVLGLTSDSSTLMHKYFTGAIDLEEYSSAREILLHRLRSWTPPIRNPDSPTPMEDYITCVAAGRAHSLASQIFLQRSTDTSSERNSRMAKDAQDLSLAITQVGSDSPSITTMLWPLFVLGCESWISAEMRQGVVDQFQSMLMRQRFMNIDGCLQTLQSQIWTMPLAEQTEWVRVCWERRIRMILA